MPQTGEDGPPPSFPSGARRADEEPQPRNPSPGPRTRLSPAGLDVTRKNPLAELLGRILRDERIPRGEIGIRFVHRGAEGGTRSVSGEEILGASAHGIELADGTVLPLHRVREVQVSGETLWRRLPPPA